MTSEVDLSTLRSDLAVPAGGALDTATQRRILEVVAQSQSASTIRNYRGDWNRFASWCAARQFTAMPAAQDTIAAYLIDAADTRTDGKVGDRVYSPATLSRWVSSINFWHRTQDLPAPGSGQLVMSTLAGLRREYASEDQRPTKRREPLRTADIKHLVATARRDATTWVDEVRERRDSALLLLGYVGAFRRSELVALTFADVRRSRSDGLHVRVRRSKTDQTGKGQVKAAPYADAHESCPVCAVHRWQEVVCAFDRGGRPAVIRVASLAEPFTRHVCRDTVQSPNDALAPLFRGIRKNGNFSDAALSGAAVHAVIRSRAAAAGMSADDVAMLGGHSLRAGFVTEAISNGADPHSIIRQTGHASQATIEIYARERTPMENNAVRHLGM
ncbi:site-specific integrase [Rhodococcus sp. Q]|uniref:site-specific integrase n=1 Tax=Rhodococcus sp. Q TaxID=2502252 RepID=UPI0010F71A57|nr:site-specific integrase [Rhodococcus sp. Q]